MRDRLVHCVGEIWFVNQLPRRPYADEYGCAEDEPQAYDGTDPNAVLMLQRACAAGLPNLLWTHDGMALIR